MFWFKKKKETTSLDIVEQPSTHEGHCYLSASMRINGDVTFSGTLRVDGRIDGKVSIHQGKKGTLILSKDAVIYGPVRAGELICDGTIQGDVLVDGRLELRSHAIIRGQVSYSTIHIAEGAKLEGRCVQHNGNIISDAAARTSRPKVVAGTALQSGGAVLQSSGMLEGGDMNFLKKSSAKK